MLSGGYEIAGAGTLNAIVKYRSDIPVGDRAHFDARARATPVATVGSVKAVCGRNRGLSASVSNRLNTMTSRGSMFEKLYQRCTGLMRKVVLVPPWYCMRFSQDGA